MSTAFQQTQKQFVSSIRSGVPVKGDQETQRRMGIYQSLLFNNVRNFVDSAFPVLQSVVDETRWGKLVRDFFQTWKCESPYFIAISESFLTYLNAIDIHDNALPPFTLSLAHYEWLELHVSIRDVDVRFSPLNAEVINIKISPLATVVSYPFPVHQISRDFQPQEQSGPHHYVVFRDPHDEVQFTKLTPATAFVLQVLAQDNDGQSIKALKSIAVESMPNVDPVAVEAGLDVAVDDMLGKGILISV